MREASIHITESKLRELIKEFNRAEQSSIPAKSLARFLAKRGKYFHLSHRILLATHKKTKKKEVQLSFSGTEDTLLFSGLYFSIRKQKKHRGISIVKEGTRDWGYMKEGAALAFDFCEHYQIENKRDGFITYINLFMDIATKPSINVFPARHDQVCERWEAMIALNEDPHPNKTAQAYETYDQIIFEKTGNRENFKDMPEKYIYFKEAVDIALRMGLSPKQYIEAQFESLDWKKGIPNTTQLVSAQAKERIIKWMAENDISKESGEAITGPDLKHILKYGKSKVDD